MRRGVLARDRRVTVVMPTPAPRDRGRCPRVMTWSAGTISGAVGQVEPGGLHPAAVADQHPGTAAGRGVEGEGPHPVEATPRTSRPSRGRGGCGSAGPAPDGASATSTTNSAVPGGPSGMRSPGCRSRTRAGSRRSALGQLSGKSSRSTHRGVYQPPRCQPTWVSHGQTCSGGASRVAAWLVTSDGSAIRSSPGSGAGALLVPSTRRSRRGGGARRRRRSSRRRPCDAHRDAGRATRAGAVRP